MNVLFISPAFPYEMKFFVRGLKEVGATVIGLGDQPAAALPRDVQDMLAHHVRATSLWDEARTVQEVLELARRVTIDRVECLWEPGMILAARLREALGVPGMTVEETIPFRDKEVMKQRLDDAGIRTPRHHRATTAHEVRAAAEAIGYPLIVKPIAGAGSADTHRVNEPSELEAILPRIAHVPEVSVEEFVEGEEFTFDTVCVNGDVAHFNIAWYRPRPLIARQLEWVCPQTLCLRDPFVPYLEPGRRMGMDVLRALRFRTGYTHMEWYLKADGEAVFGEIGARAPGARTPELLNYASDIDTFRGWAECVVHGRWSQPIERKYNCAHVFKRAQGRGVIRRIEGVEHLLGRHGKWIPVLELLPVGARRRDWKATLISDGMMIARHPELDRLAEICDDFATHVQMFASED